MTDRTRLNHPDDGASNDGQQSAPSAPADKATEHGDGTQDSAMADEPGTAVPPETLDAGADASRGGSQDAQAKAAPASGPSRVRRFLQGWRLSWELRGMGHFYRRLWAHLVDGLVLLALGTALFFGTENSPYRRVGDSVILAPFSDIPGLGGMNVTWQYPQDMRAQGGFWSLFPYHASGRADGPQGRSFTYPFRFPDGSEHRITYTQTGSPWLLLLSVIYFALLTGFRGQTVGKRLMGLRVVRQSGQRLGYMGALWRAFLYPLSALSHLGVLWILPDRDYRGWHDWLARTRVVDA